MRKRYQVLGKVGRKAWTVAEARSKFGQLLQEAQTHGPQTITRNGRVAAMLIAVQEWRPKSRRHGNLAEFLLASPLRGSGVKFRRLSVRLQQNTL